MSSDIEELKRHWKEEGWLFVPQLLDEKTVTTLRMAAERCLARWRLHSPEMGAAGGFSDAPSMRHLNHPGYYENRRDLLTDLQETVARPEILSIVRSVLNDEPLFRSTSLFMNPLETSVDGDWHRDIQFVYPDEADERARLERSWKTGAGGLQLQIALVPSDDTEYVPGSHLRWDTPEEYAIRCASDRKDNRSNQMPGAMRVSMQPGDAVAFNSAGIHRGRYHTDKYRRTFMLTYTAAARPGRGEYFTKQPWCLEEGYLDGLSDEARDFWQRFIDRFRGFWESSYLGS